jgi:hypothetical protein
MFPLTGGDAQTQADPWSSPINLSNSGSATNPTMLLDGEGSIHIIWEDEFSEFVYTTGDGTTWSDPVALSTPFIDYSPTFISDNEGNVFAFWIGAEGVLLYSRNTFTGLPDSEWTSPIQLAEEGLVFDVAVDAENRLHFIYLRSLDSVESPSGIYYIRSGPGGTNWSNSELLNESLYFRALEVEDAHLDMSLTTVGEEQHIYVSWDNRTRARVFLISSLDSGDTWGSPYEVDKPGIETGASSPSNLLVYAQGASVLLIWRITHLDLGCTYEYQWSFDSGQDWQLHDSMFEDLLACPEEIKILENGDQPLLFISAVETYLSIWDGTRWSNPQIQDPLTSFLDSETNRLVEFGCHDPILVNSENLMVAGCDESIGGDIWWMRRQLGDISSWFPEAPVWSPFETVTSGTIAISDPVMAIDRENQTHVFWTQSIPGAGGAGNSSIYYSQWEGEREWSQPIAAIMAPDGDARQPAVVIDGFGNLNIAWSEGKTGTIKFSKVAANRAAFPEDYLDPVTLPGGPSSGSSPEILFDRGGIIHVAYAIPLNEGRGIYLTSSEDGGTVWTDPIQIFDAQAANWEMVDDPQLAQGRDNELFILWTRSTLPTGPGPLELYFSKSIDGGLSWSPAELVVDKPPAWNELQANTEGTVHRIWQEVSSGGTTIWHDLSLADGQDWERTSPVSIFGSIATVSSVATDSSLRLNLVQIVGRGAGNFSLQHWIWDSAGWRTDQHLDFTLEPSSLIQSVISGVSSTGELLVLFSGESINPDIGQREGNLQFTHRSLDIPDVDPVEQRTITPENTPVPTETPAPTETATATAVPTTAVNRTPFVRTPAFTAPEGNEPSQNSWSGLIISGVVVFVVIIAAIGIRRYSLRQSRQ